MTAPAPTPMVPLNLSLGNSGPAVSGANPMHNANWQQADWDPFGNKSAGPLGLPWLVWVGVAVGAYFLVIK